MEYANLNIVDLSKAATVEGKAELVNLVREAMTKHGFFYVINHGYSLEEVRTILFRDSASMRITTLQNQRVVDIADLPFSQVDAEEKQRYAGTMKQTGSYQGYKPRQYWVGIAQSTCAPN